MPRKAATIATTRKTVTRKIAVSVKAATITTAATVTDQVKNDGNIVKIENVTKGLTPSYSKRLGLCNSKYISVICDYISALRSEIKLSDAYRQSILNTLMTLSRISSKDFKDFTRADVIMYLNQFRKDDQDDPTHKWIGTYNANLINLIKFFRWLYHPNLEPTKRPKPAAVQNLARFKRGEISGYKPSDMWNATDNLLFLKYCPNPRDRCYHAMEADVAARPHELLNLRIKDVDFREDGGSRYAKIVVNGKTGERALPLIDSIPYVTQWISLHPQGSNREAILLPNTQTGKAIQVNAMFKAYKNYRKYFTSLLSSDDVPEEDKKKIRDLLNKKWNPYVHRHSAITEKSGMLSSDSKLRQYADWTPRSNMHYKYVHLSGGESMKDLLKAKGILKEDKLVNILSPKTCPNCREPNKPDAQFCFKCNFVMSFEAYQKGMEERETKDREIHELKEQMYKMQQDFKSYDESVKEVLEKVKYERKWHQREEEGRRILHDMLDKESPGWYNRYLGLLGIGPTKPLSKEARKKIEDMSEWMRANPDTDNDDYDK
jgi:integrase/recombinase XerD